MNNLNVTISYFEEAIRESDEIIADCSPALQAELTEQKGHFEVALEAMKENERLREAKQEPITVGDTIRRMSNAEIADLLISAEGAGYNDDSIAPDGPNGYSIDMLEWLNQPIRRNDIE